MGDSAPQAKVDVGVIMGSQSDWPTMAHVVHILEEFGIAHEVEIVSAHRTPTGFSLMPRARRPAA